MSTSRHEGRVLLDAAFNAGDDQFADTVYLKHGLINGLNHIADEWSQVRVSVGTPDLTLKTGTYTHAAEVSGSTDDADAWILWFAMEFPVTVIAPGTPHLFRFWIGATSDDAGMDAELRAVLVPHGTPLTETLVEDATDSIWASAVINGGDPPAYVTGATLGDEAYPSALVMPEAPEGPVMGILAVYAKTTSDAGSLELHALHLSEVVPV
jgi:hypothetical protein